MSDLEHPFAVAPSEWTHHQQRIAALKEEVVRAAKEYCTGTIASEGFARRRLYGAVDRLLAEEDEK